MRLVKTILRESEKLLLQHHIPDVKESAINIVAAAVGQTSPSYVRNMVFENKSLTEEQERNVINSVQRRCKREPLQYIIGNWDFGKYTFKIRAPVLCPRPETEELVEHAVAAILRDPVYLRRESLGIKYSVLEIGCGSGVIGISLAKSLPDVEVYAFDISADAVSLTKENAKDLGVSDRVHVFHADFLEIEDISKLTSVKQFYALVSNPPYIPESQLETLQPEVLLYEDHRALIGGPTGLEFICACLKHSDKWLAANSSVLLELDSSHPGIIKRIIDENCSSPLTIKFSRTFGGHLDISVPPLSEYEFSALNQLAPLKKFLVEDLFVDFTGTPRFAHLKKI